MPVVAGATDGLAGCLASGAKEPGDLNVTLGTTLIFKAVSPQPLLDPDGVVYNHRHPAGGYLPGAASSTGAEWVEAFFRGEDLERWGREAAARRVGLEESWHLVRTRPAGILIDSAASSLPALPCHSVSDRVLRSTGKKGGFLGQLFGGGKRR